MSCGSSLGGCKQAQNLILAHAMDGAERYQMCPRCSVPGGEQHTMKRMKINFTESVDMCPNQKCLWVCLVSTTDEDSQVPLPGGFPNMLGLDGGAGDAAGDGDEFDLLLNSLCERSVDSGVDADGSVTSWEPASSDTGSLCSELAGAALSSVAYQSGRAGDGDILRPASAPCRAPSTVGSLATEVRSEPDPAALRRAANRRSRTADQRPVSGLSLRTFENAEARPANQKLITSGRSWHVVKSLKRGDKAARKVRQAERLDASTPRPASAAAKVARPVRRRTTTTSARAAASVAASESASSASAVSESSGSASTLAPASSASNASASATSASISATAEPSATATAAPAATSPTSMSASAGPSITATASLASSAASGSVGLSALTPGSTDAFVRPTSSASSTSTTAHSAVSRTRSRSGPAVRVEKPTSIRYREVASRMSRMLASPELLRGLQSTLRTDQVYVRARQVERVRAWARKKAAAAERP